MATARDDVHLHAEVEVVAVAQVIANLRVGRGEASAEAEVDPILLSLRRHRADRQKTSRQNESQCVPHVQFPFHGSTKSRDYASARRNARSAAMRAEFMQLRRAAATTHA